MNTFQDMDLFDRLVFAVILFFCVMLVIVVFKIPDAQTQAIPTCLTIYFGG